MTALRNSYAEIITDCKILYVPSCLVVEMLTKLYSQVSRINLAGCAHSVVPDLLVLLRRLSHSLKATAEAYEEKRIRFFIGDWKDDKLRARKLFFNLMSRLGYLCELFGTAERNMLYGSIEEMCAEWTALDRIMEKACEPGEDAGRCLICRYFRSDSSENWRTVMARTILELDAAAEYPDEETYLILLCYERVGKAFVRAIETMRRRGTTAHSFSPERILCISNEELPINCPKCGRMTENLRQGVTEVIHKDYAEARAVPGRKSRGAVARPVALRGRYPMPPSVAGIVR